MKYFFRFFITITVAFIYLSCNSKRIDVDSKKNEIDSLQVERIDKIIRHNYHSLRLEAESELFLDDDGNVIIAYSDSNHNIHLFDCEGHLLSEYSDSPQTIILHSKGNRTYNAFIDGLGNTTVYDSNGNIYNFFTDDFGNTTGYGPDGEIYQSFTDDFGNTTIYGE